MSGSNNRANWGRSPTFVIALTILIDITGYGLILPLLPFYAATFQAGSTALGVLVSAFSIMQFIFAPVLGRASDRLGRRPLLLFSIFLSGTSFIIFTFANSYVILLLSRLIGGMATESAIAQAYIADVTSETERAKGMGKVGAAFGAGFVIGPAIGGFLSVYGFSAPGLAAFSLTIVNLAFVFFFLPESKRTPVRADADTTGFQHIMEALTRSRIGMVIAISFIITLAFSALPVIAPLIGKIFFNFGEVEMSYVFVYIGVIQIVLQGFLIGRLVKKFGEEKLIVLGSLLMVLGMLIIPLISSIPLFMLSFTIIPFSIGITDTAIPSFISKRTSKNEQGSILGVAQSVASIARIPGPLIGGLIFEFAGIAAPFFLSATLLLIAFSLSCRLFQICSRTRPL